MIRKKKNKNTFWILCIIILIFCEFMSYKAIPFVVMKSIQLVTIFLMIVSISTSKPLPKNGVFLKKYVLLFMFIPWLSVIPAYISHGQTILESAMVLLVETTVFTLFFFMLKKNITEKQVMKMLTGLALVYVFLELFQQLTYPSYWFAGREESEVTGQLEMRQGLYKFYMTGIHLLTLPLMYYWDDLIQKASIKKGILYFILVIGQYAFLARKLLFALATSIGYFFVAKKGVKWYAWVILIAVATVIYVNVDVWFSEYIERTRADIDAGDDWVRTQSTVFFLSYFDDAACLLFGNGRENGDSAYGHYIRGLGDMYHMRRGDIGIYAHFSFYGIVGLIPLLLFTIYMFRNWKYLPIYIKMYFVYHLVQLTIAFPLNSINGTMMFVVVLYLCEINIREKMALKQRFKSGPVLTLDTAKPAVT